MDTFSNEEISQIESLLERTGLALVNPTLAGRCVVETITTRATVEQALAGSGLVVEWDPVGNYGAIVRR